MTAAEYNNRMIVRNMLTKLISEEIHPVHLSTLTEFIIKEYYNGDDDKAADDIEKRIKEGYWS